MNERSDLPVAVLATSPTSPATRPVARPIDHPTAADAVVDAAFPPTLGELSFDSGGGRLNGLMYVASGPGPHPTVIILHGYPGYERNLDLAQAVRRAGMNVLYFDYRGTWGSGGEFSIARALEDAATSVEHARGGRPGDPAAACGSGRARCDDAEVRSPRQAHRGSAPRGRGSLDGGGPRRRPRVLRSPN